MNGKTLNNKKIDNSYQKYIEDVLEESEIEASDPNRVLFTHDEIFDSVRKIVEDARLKKACN